MKPHRIIKVRHPSAPALCLRYDEFLEGYCAAKLQIVVTRNPMEDLPFQQLIVERCEAGHAHHVQGVSLWLDSFVVDDGDDDTGAIGL